MLYAVVAPSSSGEGWGAGGGGDAMGVSLVSNVPLPANPVKTENVLANDSKGLTQSQPKPVEKEPDAIRDSGCFLTGLGWDWVSPFESLARTFSFFTGAGNGTLLTRLTPMASPPPPAPQPSPRL